jgi:hypothetical protein
MMDLIGVLIIVIKSNKNLLMISFQIVMENKIKITLIFKIIKLLIAITANCSNKK